MRALLHIGFIIFVLIDIGVSFGQSKEELRERIEKKEEEIATANQLLEDTRASKKSSLNELYLLQRRIELRNELIEHLNNQISDFNQRIQQNQESINQLESELKSLKDNYARIIYNAFKHQKGFGKLMFILSAESFNQAYKRIKYLNQLAEYRRNQAQQIQVKTQKLKYKIKELKNLKEEKKKALSQRSIEKNRLKKEQSRIQNRLTSLRQRERQLRREIDQNKQMVSRLEKEIQQIIDEERKSTDMWKDLSARQKEISNAFENNQGSLPWPVTDGIITRKFGENTHPVLKNIKMFNNGIDIRAAQRSEVKCIWTGVVRKVVSITGANLTVIVRHGNYLSVYSNLVEVKVKPGDVINKGDIIGEVPHDPSSGENVLHLEIYKENRKLNPEKWLK
ncbi:MAG: peptidoglycan DD-metalloendopeptidase family protein [Bacteroidales bacterium]|nr:peptidoglycan DD-metalloendopeptidase family protein [Bacteroidales bacterium]